MCCAFVFGRFLSGEQPLDPRFHRAARLDAAPRHGASARHELGAFTGHVAETQRRAGETQRNEHAFPVSQRRRKPYGDENAKNADGALKIFAGRAAFETEPVRSAREREEGTRTEGQDVFSSSSFSSDDDDDVSVSHGIVGATRGKIRNRESERKPKMDAPPSPSALGMESAPEFEEDEFESAADFSITLDGLDVFRDTSGVSDADSNANSDANSDANVGGEQDASAELRGFAKSAAEKERTRETETAAGVVAGFKREAAMGRRGGVG